MTRYGCDSEYAALTAVLLYRPTIAIAAHPDPLAVQQLRPIDHGELTAQLDSLTGIFQSCGIAVTLIDPPDDPADCSNYNMMFCRDLFFMTPAGAILASMANDTRRGEVNHAARTLKAAGIPVIHTINGTGRFEGADALWINKTLVAVGIGNRTNGEAFTQIAAVLASQGVTAVPLPSVQKKTQHLLGSLQIVAEDLALVRGEIISPETVTFLQKHGFELVTIPENPEITDSQALNIVTLAPRTLIMTAGCPETKKVYENAGINVAAELPISQLINGAGGLACTTGILARNY